MFSRMLIRKKLLCSTILLVATLLMLMVSSLRGVLAYRQLTKSIETLSYEVKEMWNLGQEVAELRSYFRQPTIPNSRPPIPYYMSDDRANFLAQVDIVRVELDAHSKRIHKQIESDPLLTASEDELRLVAAIRAKLKLIESDAFADYHSDTLTRMTRIAQQLDALGQDTASLFAFMTERMRGVRADMRSSYHRWIAAIVTSSSLALLIVGFSFWFFRRNVVQPFKILLNGSRRIARGDFEYRIELNSHDELAELAEAQNKMTSRFLEIRNHLNEKVQQRTQEVVRSEQLASVGFLAAGVAHEINNPLASIAWSAEALESRLHEILHATDSQQSAAAAATAGGQDQVEVLRKYLRRIQEEAFRCKGITERLLDFSRLGESQRKQETDIHESVADVIALVKHLGQYRNRAVEFKGSPGLLAWVSPTEFKQVVLNLLTNSLDASEDGDVVHVQLEADESSLTLTLRDQGCGMTEEVITHLFEPFFTRRRDGRGTGLGLSISYRIVQDHGGSLVPSSQGPGQGSTFVLRLPLEPLDNENHERLKAAA